MSEAFPVRGEMTADGMVLFYRGIAPGGGGLLDFRHEMRAHSDGTIGNTVSVSKFGVPLALSTVTFAKSEPALKAYREAQ